MQGVHLVTGGTGFVGSALILELLQQRSDLRILGLVRPKEGVSADARLKAALHEAAGAYDVPAHVREAIDARCTGVAGDLEQTGCGVDLALLPSVQEVWHSAASLRFENRYEAEIFATNVDGTRRVIELARDLGSQTFNYMSTAYVAGQNTGRIGEHRVTNPRPNNQYERSKLAAEELVRAETGFGTRVFRPSIVIGHSRTFQATNFTGLYGFLRKLNAFRGLMARTQKGLLEREGLRLRADGPAALDLVPIDRVVGNAVAIAQRAPVALGESHTYHLTNPTPPTIEATMNVLFSSVGLPEPNLVEDRSSFRWLDKQFGERSTFYDSYIVGHKTFDRSGVESLVPEEPCEAYDLTESRLHQYCRWYVDTLRQSRTSMPATR